MSVESSIRVTCPKCDHTLRAPVSAGGKRVRCPNAACGVAVVIPSATTQADAKPAKPHDHKWLWVYFICAAVGAAFLLGAIVGFRIGRYSASSPSKDSEVAVRELQQTEVSTSKKDGLRDGSTESQTTISEAKDDALPRDGAGDPALTYEVVSKNPAKYRGKRVTWSFVPCSTENEAMLCSLHAPAARKPGAGGMYVVRFPSVKEAGNPSLLMAGFSAGSTVTATIAGETEMTLVQRDRLGTPQNITPNAKLPLLIFPVCKLASEGQDKPTAGQPASPKGQD